MRLEIELINPFKAKKPVNKDIRRKILNDIPKIYRIPNVYIGSGRKGDKVFCREFDVVRKISHLNDEISETGFNLSTKRKKSRIVGFREGWNTLYNRQRQNKKTILNFFDLIIIKRMINDYVM